MDGSVNIATVITDKEQFIITLQKDHTIKLCEVNEEYGDYCSLTKPFTNASFNERSA
jgi:hypothetical protein